jgi:hypothetical protein
MNLDVIVAVGCGWIAVALFALHVISSPRRHGWMTLPEYVRKGLIVTGATFTWRSVNLFTLPQPPSEPGHVNAIAVIATLAMAYTITALTWWAVRKFLPGKGWFRLEWVERVERERPDLAPVMMEPDDLEHAARARGIHVNAKPPKKSDTESLH